MNIHSAALLTVRTGRSPPRVSPTDLAGGTAARFATTNRQGTTAPPPSPPGSESYWPPPRSANHRQGGPGRGMATSADIDVDRAIMVREVELAIPDGVENEVTIDANAAPRSAFVWIESRACSTDDPAPLRIVEPICRTNTTQAAGSPSPAPR